MAPQTTTTFLPAELTECPQFVIWRREQRPGEDKPTKVPYDPHTGGKAQSNNSKTWGSLDDVLGACERSGYDGIGFVFSPEDPYTGIDLEKCRNPNTGEIAPWPQKIINLFPGAYVEVSPSGTGVHIIVKGTLPEGGRKKGKVEMYDQGRYFTMTGECIGEMPEKIAEHTGAKVLEAVLGRECEALLGSDHYSSYRAYIKKGPALVQFCLAHRKLRGSADEDYARHPRLKGNWKLSPDEGKYLPAEGEVCPEEGPHRRRPEKALS